MNKKTKQEILSYVIMITLGVIITLFLNGIYEYFEFNIYVYGGVTGLSLVVIAYYLMGRKESSQNITMLFLIMLAVAFVLQIVVGLNPSIEWRPEFSYANMAMILSGVLIANVFSDWIAKQVF